ncbi:unnamed protein product [Ranitomeya imitator]|uniref:Uncharacterized protein n=1 Tax=Ranitomeya imitator TaxID=111125 RepID=A0ABN9M1M9_9NEOB|nr:unnamed protein product [Ranitomeya imitator]
MKSTSSATLLFWFTLAITKAAKMIIVPPIMFESHLYIFKTVATALHEKGHETEFLVSEGREIPPSSHYKIQRYPGIFNSTTSDEFLQSKMKNIFSGRFTALEMFDILDHYSSNCDIMVGNQELMQRLKKENYDMVIVDPNEMCGLVIANILDIKYVVFSTGLWFPVEVGAPAPLSYVPEFNSLLTDRMDLLERIKNTIVYLVSRFGINFIVLPKYDRIMRKYNILPARSMYELIQGSSLWLLCTDVALEFPRPTLPHVVYVGGILTKPVKPLPQGPRHRWSLESCLCDSSPATTLRFTYDHGQVISLVVIVGGNSCDGPSGVWTGFCYAQNPQVRDTLDKVLRILEETHGDPTDVGELRMRLFRRVQREGETMMQYMNALQELHTAIIWKDGVGVGAIDIVLRDQLLTGLRDVLMKQALRERMRVKPDMTFSEVESETCTRDQEQGVIVPVGKVWSGEVTAPQWVEDLKKEVKRVREEVAEYKETPAAEYSPLVRERETAPPK